MRAGARSTRRLDPHVQVKHARGYAGHTTLPCSGVANGLGLRGSNGSLGGWVQAGTRKAARAAAYMAGSLAPHSSRAECIDSIGAPKSTVVAPISAAVIGPTVEPQAMSPRDTKCCTGTPAWSQAVMNAAAPTESVA